LVFPELPSRHLTLLALPERRPANPAADTHDTTLVAIASIQGPDSAIRR